ncbi:hypothetical protein C8R43DRAFT_1121641 [Mycena crocata]|nr:hypothetical protein C8R43DRAFT_1121641 [Mycena crocata]
MPCPVSSSTTYHSRIFLFSDSPSPTGYNYTSDEATASRTPATSDYFAAPQSEAGGSSVPGFAGLGAGSAAGVGYGVGLGTAYAAGGPGGYDPHSTSSDGGQISPRRGFHTTGASTSSFASLPNPHGGASAAGAAAVGAAAAAGSTSGSGSGRDRSGSGAASGAASLSGSRSSGRQEERRAQAPPLPRKRARGAAAPAAAAPAAPAVGRAPSEEPFLEEEDHEREPWRDVDLDLDRHQDGGPVSDVSLGRSASGRLPPAYGAIHPER